MIKTLTSKTVYKNPWMTVVEDTVEFSNGHQGIYGVVDKADFALIIPFDGQYLHLVKQYRYPLKKYSLEFPQGRHEDENENETDPLQLAKDELQEELGLKTASINKIGYLHEAPGYSNQGFHVFLATELTQGVSNFDETETDLEHVQYTVDEFEQAILDGTIKDSPTLSAYLLFKIKIGK